MVAHTYNPSTWEDEAGGHGVWGQSEQNSKFKANLGLWSENLYQNF